MSGARQSVVLAALATVVVACSVAAPPADPAATPVPPMATPSPAVAAAVARLRDELQAVGVGLAQSPVEHRPGEPAIVQNEPRAVYRAQLADPDEGWVLIYDLGTADRAQAAGEAFAAYLASGVGQTNYPRDARFALSRVGAALVYSYWSPGRSADAQAAGAVLDAVRLVGQPIEVRR